jgi:SAM-dependent methyltransferase
VPEFAWPIPPGASRAPTWTGSSFLVDGKECKFLSFGGSASGWTEELTEFHESTSGSGVPIDIASRRNAVKTLRRFLHAPSPVILEIGSSSGFLLEDLRDEFHDALIIGSDYSGQIVSAIAVRLPHMPLIQFDVLSCPIHDNSLDAVVLLNVLEHIENDVLALTQVNRILKPGGVAYIEIPAGPHLFDLYDRCLLHYRRYSRQEAITKARSAGFDVETASHLGFFVYPAFSLVKKRNQKKTALSDAEMQRIVGEQIRGSRGSRLMTAVFAVEHWLGKFVSYPCGIRCILVCKKRA